MSEQRIETGADAATSTDADPGSVATEFGDRADEAPGDDIAHPTI